jgi:hemerythrin
MNYVKWENEYNTGNDKIDEQHQRVFIFINKLNLALRTSRDKEEIIDILKGLKDYSAHHFKLEEDQMLAANYPKYDTHKAEHQIFVDRLTKLTTDIESKGTTINLRLLNFLKVWFSGHILNTDKKLVIFLSERTAN